MALLTLVFSCVPGAGPNGLQCVASTVIDPMKSQSRNDPYSENAFFDDGRAMRHPPHGTVPRRSPLPSDPLSTGSSDGGTLDKIPLPLSETLFADGRTAFEISCAVCHGLAADGDSVVARQMQLRPPPSLYEARLRALSDGDLFRVITEGYGLMPAYRSEIRPYQRWAIVAYVRALQRSHDIPIGEVTPDVRARIVGGQP